MNFAAFLPLSLLANILIFVLATMAVWIAGTRLAVYGDELSDRFSLSRAFIGLVFLATVTSLPEIVTTITAATAGNAQLVLGNMFGGVTMQTAILAVVDILFVRYALTSWPRKPTHALEAVLLIILLNIILAVSFLGEFEVFWGIGLGALSLTVFYPLVIVLLHRYDEQSPWQPIDIPENAEETIPFIKSKNIEELSKSQLIWQSAFASLMILIAGFILANRADIIADQAGLSSTVMASATTSCTT